MKKLLLCMLFVTVFLFYNVNAITTETWWYESNGTAISQTDNYVYINYTLNGTMFRHEVKHGTADFYNVTINSTCTENFDGVVELRLQSWSASDQHISRNECYNSTHWNAMSIQSIYTGAGYLGDSLGWSNAIDNDENTGTFWASNGATGWSTDPTANAVYATWYEEGLWQGYKHFLEIVFTESTNYTVYFVEDELMIGEDSSIVIALEDVSTPSLTISFNDDTQRFSVYTDDLTSNVSYTLEVLDYSTFAEPTFIVKDQFYNYIEGAFVEASIDGENITYSGTTDNDGFVRLNLEDSYTYYICTSKVGYTTNDDSCIIAEQHNLDDYSEYTLFLDSSETITEINLPEPVINRSNVSVQRINLTMTRDIFTNNSLRYQGMFIALILCMLFAIVIENKLPGGGIMGFLAGNILFSYLFPILLLPPTMFALVQGLKKIKSWL